MKILAPEYYSHFRCIADRCTHTCCVGWEIEVDEESLQRFRALPDVAPHITGDEDPQIRLLEGERCPFLTQSGLCQMILDHGEDVLCDICADHPRFRSFWSDRVELGLGMVCEEAARLILSWPEPLRLVELEDDGEDDELPEDEAWLMDIRRQLLERITDTGPKARLMEYLIFRHIPNALYDDRLDDRLNFVKESFRRITAAWEQTDGSLEQLAECARQFSYDYEYNDEAEFAV